LLRRISALAALNCFFLRSVFLLLIKKVSISSIALSFVSKSDGGRS
jgi:hypothetical protein